MGKGRGVGRQVHVLGSGMLKTQGAIKGKGSARPSQCCMKGAPGCRVVSKRCPQDASRDDPGCKRSMLICMIIYT